jgi:acetyltransferase-like isoleucine patch superfamily enzyme
MNHYGALRPLAVFAEEVRKAGVQRARILWHQRNIEAARGARIASSVECRGSGRIVVREGARVRRDVVLVAEDNATVEIGPHADIGEGTLLWAREGQQLMIGSRVEIRERVRVYSVAGVTIGEGTAVYYNTLVSPREAEATGSLTIGEYVEIGPHNILDLCSDIWIGDHVHSGPFCAVYTHNHVHYPGSLTWELPIKRSPVRISCGAWIGHGSVLLSGVEVGEGAVIAAGAVVTRSVPDNTVAGGVPARPIGDSPSALGDRESSRPSGARNDARTED